MSICFGHSHEDLCYHRYGNPRDYYYCYLFAHTDYILVYQTQLELVITTAHCNHPNDIDQRAVTPRLWACFRVPLSSNLVSIVDSSNSLVQTVCPTYSPKGRLQTIRHTRETQKILLHDSHDSVAISSSNPSWINPIWPGQLQTQGKSLLPIARPKNIKNNQRNSIMMTSTVSSVADLI